MDLQEHANKIIAKWPNLTERDYEDLARIKLLSTNSLYR